MTADNITNHAKENKETVKEAEGQQGNAENVTTKDREDVKEDKHAEHKEDKKRKSGKEKSDVKIQELESKVLELSDKHLRLQAEFDNYRKRTIREKAELIKSGGEAVLESILPVIDDFERAIGTLKEVPDTDSVKQGIVLIYNKFKDFLSRNNVREIEAIHKDFDVDHHEAITKVPAPEEKLKGKILEVIQKGYTLNDKVIRFAKVVIGE